MHRIVMLALGLAWVVIQTVSAQQNAQGPRHLLLLLRSEQGRVVLVASREVAGPLPRARARAATSGWSFEALNDKDEVVFAGNAPDPHILRGVFKESNGSTSGVELTSSGDQTFAVRVPYGSSTVVVYGAPVRALATRSKTKANVVLGRIKL